LISNYTQHNYISFKRGVFQEVVQSGDETDDLNKERAGKCFFGETLPCPPLKRRLQMDIERLNFYSSSSSSSCEA
jgi:hypothetical protein